MSYETLQGIDLTNIPKIAPIELFYKEKIVDKYEPLYGFYINKIFSFKTFWGAFPAKQWLANTKIEDLILDIKVKGKFILKIKAWDGCKEEILYKKFFNIENLQIIKIEVNLQNIISSSQVIIYPEFEVVRETSPNFVLQSIFYKTTTKPLRKPSLAIIVPTYKREKYVKNLIDTLLPVLEDSQFNIDLIIVDNGQTLKEGCPYKKIKIISNLNYGGSGGFARGLLESIKENYTHVILSDDDIVIYPEIIKRTYQFFKFAKDSNIVLGGGMLKLYSPNTLNEKGALIDHLKLFLINKNLDLTKDDDLMKYIQPTDLDYFGWWFFAGSIEIFEKYGLPMPYFIRWDDQEFCLRIKDKVKFLPLFGLAVWHEDFDKKDNPVMDYYITRNGLITSILYENNKIKLIINLLKYLGSSLLTYRYERAKFILKGIEDFLKGPEFLEKLRPDKYHLELNKQAKIKPKNMSNLFIPEKFNRPITYSRVRKLLIFLTLNGHLLPKFLLQKAKKPTDEGFVIETLHSKRLQALFRKTKVLYYEPVTETGLLYTYDKKEFWKYLIQGIFKIILLYFKYSYLKNLYKPAHKKFTTIDFWKKYLRLEEK